MAIMTIDRDILFDPIKHKYTDTYENEYVSATTFKKEFETPFEYDYWLEQKAKENGITLEAMKAEWDRLKKEGCDRGNKTHNYIEKAIDDSTSMDKGGITNRISQKVVTIGDILTKEIPGVPDDKLLERCSEYPKIAKTIEYYTSHGYNVYSELVVYDPETLVSGTVDCPLINFKTKSLIIIDWKTYKNPVQFESGYYKKSYGMPTDNFIRTNTRYKHPISHLPQCNGNDTAIQVSLYAYLAELWGLKLEQSYLCHIRNKEIEKYAIDPVKFYRLQYLKAEILAMLKIRKFNLSKTRNIQGSLFSSLEKNVHKEEVRQKNKLRLI